jgi:glycosyltransferase involved in cell wall biosynthesis
MPSSPDVSIVLNVHAGMTYLPRALRSLEDAAYQAADAGLRIDLLFVLDRSTPAVKAIAAAYKSSAYAEIGAVEVSNGSLGLSRNDGLKHARGRYVMFADDDDLVSANSVVAFHRAAEAAGPRTIIVPQYLVGFGSSYVIAEYLGSDAISPLVFFAHHPYVSRLFLARSAFPELRFADIPPNRGYAFEDWHFNANAVARGYSFAHAPKTILFYRQRAAGLLNQHNQSSVRQIPPSALFHPRTFLDRGRRSFRDGKGRSPHVNHDKVKRDFLDDTECRLNTWAANRIDPSLKWSEISHAHAWINTGCGPGPGAAYYRACEKVIGIEFSDVLLVQVVDARVRNLLSGLGRLRPANRILLLVADPHTSPIPEVWHSAQVTTIATYDLRAGISDADIDLVTLRLIENVAPNARLHLLGGHDTRRFFSTYRPVLLEHRLIYYRTPDAVETDGTLSFVNGMDFEFVSEWHNFFSAVVVGSRYLLESDLTRIGTEQNCWHVLPPVLPPSPMPAMFLAGAAEQKSIRILWFGDGSLPQHHAMRRGAEAALRAASVDVEFETLGPDDVKQGLVQWSARDLGSTQDVGRASRGYAGLVFAAVADDTPTLLIEAAAMGLPCVAPDAGGVSDIVVHQETGYLLSAEGPSAVDEIVAAVLRCLCDAPTRSRLSAHARSHVRSRYSRAAFDKAFAMICGEPRSSTNSRADDTSTRSA